MVACTGNTGRSPVLTGELVPVDWHGLPVQVTNGPDRSSGFLFFSFFFRLFFYLHNTAILQVVYHVKPPSFLIVKINIYWREIYTSTVLQEARGLRPRDPEASSGKVD